MFYLVCDYINAALSYGVPKLGVASGLALAFSLAGGVLSWLLIEAGLNSLIFRDFSAALLIIVGTVLISKTLSEKTSSLLSGFTARANTASVNFLEQWLGPFGVGLMLGFVWLPCVGPTLGAAIALASRGQDLFLASMVMLSFGLGTATSLLIAATGLHSLFKKSAPRWFTLMMSRGKTLLGVLLCVLGMLVLTGLDLKFEALILPYLPDWSQF